MRHSANNDHNSLNSWARRPKFYVEVEKQNGLQKIKWPPKKEAAKYLNFQARILKFCMEVYLDHPEPKVKNKMAAKKQNGHQ